jgi:hypothetical protein
MNQRRRNWHLWAGSAFVGFDPYSAGFYSERQSAYARRFGLDSVYTPQMVVDGTSEFVGNDSGLAYKAFATCGRVHAAPHSKR